MTIFCTDEISSNTEKISAGARDIEFLLKKGAFWGQYCQPKPNMSTMHLQH